MTTPDPQQVREIADEVFCPCPDFPKRVTLDLSEGDVTIRHVVCGNVMVTDWPYLRAHALPLTLAWVSDGEDEDWLELKAVADEQAPAEPDACVCGDPNCMPYWRPVHEQMNAMRVRADKASADFTKALLEQVCELGTELDAERARREDCEAERNDDVRAVAEFFASDKLGPAMAKLHDHFADRTADLLRRDDPAYGICECGCHYGDPKCGCPGDCLDAPTTDCGAS